MFFIEIFSSGKNKIKNTFITKIKRFNKFYTSFEKYEEKVFELGLLK